MFLILEGLSTFLLVQNQNYHKAAFINSSSAFIGTVVDVSSFVSGYFGLKRDNATLTQELAALQQQVELLKQKDFIGTGIEFQNDTIYHFTSARIVNNSYRQLNNYLTLNKGLKDGIKPDQGVLSAGGIVGKVRTSSENFSVVVSLLHTDFLVSSLLQRSSTFCTTNWDGRDPQYANLLYVPRHVHVNQGDTVKTSGFNSIFPPEQLIGIVEEVSTQPNATFHDIRIKLSTDFSRLTYVTVVDNKLSVEKDSLEQKAVTVN